MIVIAKAFTGYPEGVKRVFSPGERPAGLSKTYEAMLVKKRLAENERQPNQKKAKSDEAE